MEENSQSRDSTEISIVFPNHLIPAQEFVRFVDPQVSEQIQAVVTGQEQWRAFAERELWQATQSRLQLLREAEVTSILRGSVTLSVGVLVVALGIVLHIGWLWALALAALAMVGVARACSEWEPARAAIVQRAASMAKPWVQKAAGSEPPAPRPRIGAKQSGAGENHVVGKLKTTDSVAAVLARVGWCVPDPDEFDTFKQAIQGVVHYRTQVHGDLARLEERHNAMHGRQDLEARINEAEADLAASVGNAVSYTILRDTLAGWKAAMESLEVVERQISRARAESKWCDSMLVNIDHAALACSKEGMGTATRSRQIAAQLVADVQRRVQAADAAVVEMLSRDLV